MEEGAELDLAKIVRLNRLSIFSHQFGETGLFPALKSSNVSSTLLVLKGCHVGHALTSYETRPDPRSSCQNQVPLWLEQRPCDGTRVQQICASKLGTTSHPTPYTPHSTPFTLHSTPYTLHSTLYNLRLPPYTSTPKTSTTPPESRR